MNGLLSTIRRKRRPLLQANPETPKADSGTVPARADARPTELSAPVSEPPPVVPLLPAAEVPAVLPKKSRVTKALKH